jgi:signal transduction histidine kinase
MVTSLTMPISEHMRLCLTAPVATSVWTGPELEVQGNAAFAAFLGPQRHAAVLGRPARDAFADLWDVLEPLARRAPCVANEVRLVFDRSVPHEEVFATLIFAKHDDGLVVTWLETTDDVVARRRLETLRALASAPMRAKTVDDARAAVLAVLRANPHDIAGAEIEALAGGHPGGYPISTDLKLVLLPNPQRPLNLAYSAFFQRIVDHVVPAVALATAADASARRAEDEFLNMLAHELRNPLAPVLTTLDVLRLRGQSEELAMIDRPLRHLAQLLDDLLEYSRLARGTLRLDRKPVELSEVIERALELSRPFADRAYVAVPRSGLGLLADVDRLGNAIAHLLINAAEHGSPTARITVDATCSNGRVQLTVRNQGGIPQQVASRLFEAFVQEPQGLARPRGGLGLGLAITRSIVELHGGTISANATPQWTEVTIDLPTEAMAAAAPPAARVRTRKHKRVMIVEDNDDTARALKNALEVLGYEVAVAHNGPVALTVARTFHPDVALLDIGLPVMDGYELANRLRAMNIAARELHVVAVTAYGGDSYRQRSADAGFADHLVKPVDLAKLERVVEELPG